MPLRLSDTFFLKGTGGANNPAGAHLMVCMLANRPKDCAVIVPIVSRHAFSDAACVLSVGDHPFIKHESCAAYDHAKCLSLVAIEAEIGSGSIVLQAQVSADVLVRLQIGLVTSDETEPWLFNAALGTKLTAHLRHKGHL